MMIMIFFSFSFSGIIRNSYIRSYEPAWYDAATLRRHRDRVRRDASWPAKDQPLILRVRALDKSVPITTLLLPSLVYHYSICYTATPIEALALNLFLVRINNSSSYKLIFVFYF